MDDAPHQDPEHASDATLEDPGIISYGSVMFSGSQHFVVAGGTFHNVTNNYNTIQYVPHDFRRIPLGDIDLLREIRLDNKGITDSRRERSRVRRVYTAKIAGQKSAVTVAVYQGEDAHEELREDMELYSRLRHPNLVQLCRFASSLTMQALVFNDDLIPFEHFLELYRHSPILTVYIYGFCLTEFRDLTDYFRSAVKRPLYDFQCTFWIRCSTGRLCADLTPSHSSYFYFLGELPHTHGFTSLNAPGQEAMVIDSLTLEQYHQICYWYLPNWRNISISPDVTVNLGTVIACSSGDQLQDFVEIAFFPDVDVRFSHWDGAQGEVMEDGWTRFNSSDIFNCTLSVNMWYYAHGRSWLSQANHIFSHLGITSDFENYLVVDNIYFRIQISATTQDEPSGYLFLGPTKDFHTGPSSFSWSDFPAYWSLDSAGHGRLSAEEAIHIGFPSLRLETKLYGDSWPASVYAGLRQFHLGKGFDPDSQEVARHLGDPLFQLSTEVDPLFAHMDPDDGKTEASNLYDDIPPMLFLM